MGSCCTSATKPDIKINGTLSQFRDERHNKEKSQTENLGLALLCGR
jgi:hypothetical protein